MYVEHSYLKYELRRLQGNIRSVIISLLLHMLTSSLCFQNFRYLWTTNSWIGIHRTELKSGLYLLGLTILCLCTTCKYSLTQWPIYIVSDGSFTFAFSSKSLSRPLTDKFLQSFFCLWVYDFLVFISKVEIQEVKRKCLCCVEIYARRKVC